MKDQENKKTLKISRQRYFQMLLTLGSLGTYFSNYALNLFGIDELSIPSMNQEKPTEAQIQSTPKSILTNELQYNLVEVKKTDFGINGETPFNKFILPLSFD